MKTETWSYLPGSTAGCVGKDSPVLWQLSSHVDVKDIGEEDFKNT